MEPKPRPLIPIECHLTQNHLLDNTIDLKTKVSLSSAILPPGLSELSSMVPTHTFTFPDLRTERQLSFSGLLSELVVSFESKQASLKTLRQEVFETKKKLDLESLEVEAFQELILKTRKELAVVQDKIRDVVQNEDNEGSLAKLVGIATTQDVRRNILERCPL